jgi:hypothetical protein
MERRIENPVTSWTSSVVCTKRREGTFSLQLRVAGELGSCRDLSVTRIRSPKKFVEGLFSVADWSELKFDREEIAGEICARLSKLDTEFADAVADYIKSDDER